MHTEQIAPLHVLHIVVVLQIIQHERCVAGQRDTLALWEEALVPLQVLGHCIAELGAVCLLVVQQVGAA